MWNNCEDSSPVLHHALDERADSDDQATEEDEEMITDGKEEHTKCKNEIEGRRKLKMRKKKKHNTNTYTYTPYTHKYITHYTTNTQIHYTYTLM